jgi:putative ABC transport system permease protein
VAEPTITRWCLRVVRAISRLVPGHERDDWQREWEAEIRHRADILDARRALDWRNKMDLLRRTMGSVFDAAWLRRQFTLDAEVIQDARVSLRLLLHQPRLAIVAVVTLALGIGATTAVFSVVNAVLLTPLPFPGPERLVMLWERQPATGRERDQVAAANLFDWREQTQSFTAIGSYIDWGLALTGTDEPVEIQTGRVSPSLFTVLGVTPLLGRAFHPEEETVGRDRVVILSHGMWQTRFGSDPAILGRTIGLDQEPYQVIGVMPASFQFPDRETQMWVPLSYAPYEKTRRSQRMFYAIARLAPGVTLASAQAEMSTVAQRLGHQFPGTNGGWDVLVEPAGETAVASTRRPLLILLGAVLLVLLIACANVSSLLLARGAERQQELAIRGALGASRARLVRFLLTDTLVIALLGGAIGLAVAYWGMQTIIGLDPGNLPHWNPIALDGRVLAFTFLITMTASLLAGLTPGLSATGSHPGDTLKRARGATRGVSARRLSHAIVVMEIALSIVLLIGAGLLIRSFVRVLQQDPGFRPEGLLSVSIFLPDTRYTNDEREIRFFEGLLERLQQLPGVTSVGGSTTLPMSPIGIDHDMPFAIIGTPSETADPRPEADFRIITDDYVRTLGIPLVAGRTFTSYDHARGRPVVIVNTTMAERFFQGDNPVGRLMYWGGGRTSPSEVVGIVGEVRHRGLDTAPRPEFYVPFRQVSYGSLEVVVRTAGNPNSLSNAVKETIFAQDPALPVAQIKTMEDLLDLSLATRRFQLVLLGGFAGLALLLATIGIYGVASFTSSQRTQEFGVRLALGAQRRDVLVMVVRDTMARVALGVAIGTAAALGMTRLLEASLFEVRATDPLTIALVAGGLASVALACSLGPARKATRVDPLTALRAE